ncbi:hypothetical protein E2493_20530 [Sphingomonas parva]|uniref:Uncharacterized protein n=1 Tax=Sphingomonas parva TaxID=2555898 RepID=A0A4Y8ZMG8_9SPHN|nr:hypothetical protein [Sphingomonas parva]TFI56355.1 hypothetical protein E2493_20530 [Sphingomonas parva]
MSKLNDHPLMRTLPLLLLAFAAPALAQTEQHQVPPNQRELVRDGLAVFRSDEGGPIPTPTYSAYRIALMLETDKPALYFTYKHDNQFTQTYRLLYLAQPVYAFRRDGPILFPPPPFQGNFRSDGFVMGVALGLPENSATPPVTAWLPLGSVKLRTAP